MSRIAKKPLHIPAGVEFTIQKHPAETAQAALDSNIQILQVKGKQGLLSMPLHESVVVEVNGNVVSIRPRGVAHPMVGTTCKLLGNMFQGVSQGFHSKLLLVGVGYRAKVDTKRLELSLGFSNPVLFEIPEGISIETPSNTEIVIKGINKQLVGETAAKIRKFRPPERYKGKGVRYADEVVILKETKKK